MKKSLKIKYDNIALLYIEMPTYTCTCIYFDWWTRQQWNPPIFINIVQEAQRISECHTEEIVTLSGLLNTVLKTLPAHNKTTYMQIHVLFVYMIIYMYSYFLFL